MLAYFISKDFSAAFEITMTSAVFTASYGTFSGTEIPINRLFPSTWAFVYAVFGLNYFFSIILSQTAGQMCAVVMSFVSFCTAGVYQPQLPEMSKLIGNRGWMIPAL